MDKNMPDKFDDSVVDEARLTTGNEVGDLAMGFYGEFMKVPYSKDKSEMIAETQRLLADDSVRVIEEASFEYDGNFCSVDILIKLKSSYHIIEVKSSTDLKDIYGYDVAYQKYILEKCGLEISRTAIMLINSCYNYPYNKQHNPTNPVIKRFCGIKIFFKKG
jgi:hypothetical protein